MYKPNHFYLVCGDINVDVPEASPESTKVKTLFMEFSMKNQISKPTRLTRTRWLVFKY